MELIADVEHSWSWIGLLPQQIVGDNEFGNLLIKDQSGRYWLLRPEDLTCKVIADSQAELDLISKDQEFLHHWYMADLVHEARERFGPLRPGIKYCLKIPAALGGENGGDNLATISLSELISASGHIAQQIDGLPDGAHIKLSIVE